MAITHQKKALKIIENIDVTIQLESGTKCRDVDSTFFIPKGMHCTQRHMYLKIFTLIRSFLLFVLLQD